MSAVHEWHRRRGQWPTIEDLAAYLQVDANLVRLTLLGLRRDRLYRDRTRGGKRRWMPWETP